MRMFQFLKLPRYMPQQHVEWIAPLHTEEPLQEYVLRLKSQITDPAPILIGLSFGGVVAIELAKVLQPRQVIIISSMATRHAIPLHYRLMGRANMHHWVPFRLLQSVHPLAPFFFGAHSKSERSVLKAAILDIDETFLRWSLGQLLGWQQEEILPGLVQLHGTHDKVLPLRERPSLIKVEGGEHLMVMRQADQISAILAGILKDTWIKADTSLQPPMDSR